MLRDFIKPIHIVIASVFVVGLLVATILVKVYEAANPIVIKKVPSDAKVYIDDKEVTGNRTNLTNGTYTIRAERDGFETTTFTTIINADVQYVAVAMTANTDSTRKWAADNQNAYLELEKFVGATVENSGSSLAAANPIVKSLPLSGDVYDIGYIRSNSSSSDNSITLTVHAMSGFRNAAIRGVYDAGYNPADYTYSFEDFTNPFLENKQ